MELDIQKLLQTNEYDFIRDNEHLKNIMFLTLGGSHAYGTNIEGSDIDIRGVALNSKSDLLGMTNFDQVIDTATDTTIYSFKKLMCLLVSCNPNTIELLGNKEYYMLSEEGKLLLDNKKLFLSQKAIQSFGGYAISQLRRLENAIARDSYSKEDKAKHIVESCKSAMLSFSDRYSSFNNGDYIKLEANGTDILANINLARYPLKEFKGILEELSSIVKNYEKLNTRNTKKDDAHLNKHAMHLVRLYLMCIDILEKEEIITYRGTDIDLLMSIRAGDYQKEDHTYRAEFFELIDSLERRVEYAKNNTSLPKSPDMTKVNDLMLTIHKKVVM